MTPTTRVLIVANVTVWSAILALLLVWMFNRFWHSHGRSVAREPKEAPRPPATATRPWRVPMFLVPRAFRDRTPEHEGATEEFRDELRALRHLPVAPELAPVLTEVAIRSEVHEDLDQIMSAFRHDLDHILDGVCRQLDPYWTPVAVGELAGVTG